MKDSRGQTATPLSDYDPRAPSALSMDTRAETPLYNAWGTSSRLANNSSVTPTPQQWSRDFRGDSKELPTRCSTALGGTTHARPLTSESQQRPMSVAGGMMIGVQPERPSTTPGGSRAQLGKLNMGAANDSAQPSSAQPSSARFGGTGSCYEELFHRSRQTPVDMDDMRPVPPPRSPNSARQQALAANARRPLGGVPRGPPDPLTPPPRMAPPTVHPHNAWRVYIAWVPPAGSHEDPDFGYALVCRTMGCDTKIVINDLGNVPQACFDHLEPGMSYYFQVCACNCKGWGEWSNPSDIYIVPQPPPRPDGKPFDYEHSDNLGAVTDGRPLSSSDFATRATLHWDEPCGHGTEILGYNVQYSLNPSDPHCVESMACMSKSTSVELRDLLPNRVYYVRTQAMNSVGTSDWTDWSAGVATKAIQPEPPSAPVLLESKPCELLINWQPPFSCGFRILNYVVRISEGKSMAGALILPVRETEGDTDDDCTLRVVDLTPHSAYFFQVRAENEIGVSEWSDVSQPLMTQPCIPLACSNVQVVSNNYEKMEVQWQAPDARGLPIHTFLVCWLTADHMKEVNRIQVTSLDARRTGANQMSTWVENIKPGSKLVFRVAAWSDAGVGHFSKVSEVVVACPGKPGLPPAPVVTCRTGNSMVVKVEDTAEQHGAPITGYECRWDLSIDMLRSVQVLGPMRKKVERLDTSVLYTKNKSRVDEYEIPVTGLKKRGPYYFSVRAANEIGKSHWSPPSQPVLLHHVAPSKMSSPHLVEILKDGLMIGYTPSAELGASYGGDVLEYEMRYSRSLKLLQQDDDSPHEEVFLMRWVTPTTTRGPPPPHLTQNLLTGRSYHFQVRAVSKYGISPWSDISAAFEVLPSKPETPEAPVVQLGTDGPYSIQLSIKLPECNGRASECCAVKMYGPCWEDSSRSTSPEWADLYPISLMDVSVEHSKRSHVPDASQPDVQTWWHHTVIQLEPGAYYQFVCNCQNSEGVSNWSKPSESIATAPTAPDVCETPYCENKSDKTHDSIKVKWGVPHNGGAPISHYIVCWANNAKFMAPKIAECKEPCLHLTDLDPYQWYYMQVSAVNSNGRSRYSEFNALHGVGCFLTEATAPTAVCKLVAEILPNDNVRVRWGKPTCSGGHIITRYKIIASKEPNMEKPEFEVKQKAYREVVLKDLSPDTSWFFDVQAGSCIGYGPMSGTPATVQTKPVAIAKSVLPPAPSSPECVMPGANKGRNNSYLEVLWKCPENYDKKKGFIYKTDVQTHMILTYNVKIMTGAPESENLVTELKEVKQVRDRRTVPKDEHNCITFKDLLPGHYYSAMVQSTNDVGDSGWSAMSTGVWSAAAKPENPTDHELMKHTEGTLTLQWVCPHGNGDDVKGFRLRWKQKRPTTHRKTKFMSGGFSRQFSSTTSAKQDGSGPSFQRGLSMCAQPSIISAQQQDADDSEGSSGFGWNDEDDDLGVRHQPGEDIDQLQDISGLHGIDLSLADCRVSKDILPPMGEFEPRGGTNDGEMCSWSVTGLKPGRFFCAEVRAVNGVGCSAWVPSEILRTASSIPGPPTGLRGIPESATTSGVSFRWEGPNEDGGEPVEGYDVAWMRLAYKESPPIDVESILAEKKLQERSNISPGSCNFRAEGLLPGNSAIPIVRCWNSVGFSEWCWLGGSAQALEEVLQEIVTLSSAPSPVTMPPIIHRTAPVDHMPWSLSASWKCPLINGCPVEYFFIKVRLAGERPADSCGRKGLLEEKDLRLDHASATPDWLVGDDILLDNFHEGLIPGASYTLSVRAGTGDAEIGDCEDWGAVSSPASAPPDYPLQPSAPTCPWRWPDALQICWVEGRMNGAPQTQCDVRYSKASDMSEFVVVPRDLLDKAVESKAVVVGKLDYTTDYFFQCRIANTVGWSPWSLVSAAFLTKACRPAEPEKLETMDVQKESLTMAWDSPSDHGAAITGYEIILVDSLNRVVGGFEELVKKSNAGNYLDDEEFDADKADAAAWAVLGSIQIKDRKTINVSDASDATSSRHTFEGLLGGITYSAVVRARNRCGWSDWSGVQSVETPTAEPEQCPQAEFLDAKQNSVSVEFRLPYDNGALIQKLVFAWTRLTGPLDIHKAKFLGGSAADHRYDAASTVELDISTGGPEAAPPHGVGGRGEIVLDGLEPGTQYEVKYRAENKNGFGPWSHVIQVLTAPGRPNAPGKVRHQPIIVPGQIPDEDVEDSEPPTICFAHTSRLHASEVVQSRTAKGKSGGMFSQMVPSLSSSSSNAVSKITE